MFSKVISIVNIIFNVRSALHVYMYKDWLVCTLHCWIMLRRKISQEDKQWLIQAHLGSQDFVQVATTLRIKRGTTWSIIRRHQDAAQQGELVFPARGGTRRVKVDNEIGEAAARIVEEHPEFTLQQFNNELRLRLPHKPLICLSSLRKAALRCQLITLNTMENVPVDRNLEPRWRQDVEAHVCWTAAAEWTRNYLYRWIGISSLVIQLSRGRARQEERALRIVGTRKGPHFNFILVISNQRGVIWL